MKRRSCSTHSHIDGGMGGAAIRVGYGGGSSFALNIEIIMERKYPNSIDEMVNEMEKYPDDYQHLKVFLRHENSTGIPDFGEEYLAVSPSGFGLYCINSADYQNGRIILSLTEVSTNKAVNYSFDINNQNPSCLFIRWKDVKNMVFQGCMDSDLNDNDLFELIED
jgi:hypothetical protein